MSRVRKHEKNWLILGGFLGGVFNFLGKKIEKKKWLIFGVFLGEVFNILGKNIRESLIILTYHQA